MSGRRVFAEVEIVRMKRGSRTDAVDRAAIEEPLEVRLHARPFAVIMRTPGADRELAAGFLCSERVLRSADDIGLIEHCVERKDGSGQGHRAPAENVINVTLTGVTAQDLDDLLTSRRQVVANSACGVCGRLTIDTLRHDLPPVAAGLVVSASTIGVLPERLRTAQPLFDATGGLHAAGLFEPDGGLAASAEDVGRHNAVDKVIGRMLMLDALPLAGSVLCVSGRTSFEIVQKAWCAGIPLVASVSAPSSLAIDMAREAGITLVGFVRDGDFNIYSHPGRIE